MSNELNPADYFGPDWEKLLASVKKVLEAVEGSEDFIKFGESMDASRHMSKQFPLEVIGTPHAMRVNGVIYGRN